MIQAHPTATILTTGHSLGAALSIIAAIRIKAQYHKKTVIHNFGSPRLANPALAHYINARIDTIYRVVHNRDIVPHLPPLAFGYQHPAYEVFWNE
jgi:predicted lipase